jgi:hypothetical protein
MSFIIGQPSGGGGGGGLDNYELNFLKVTLHIHLLNM